MKRAIVGATALILTAVEAHAEPQHAIDAYLARQRWVHMAETAARDGVVYEMCGWGMPDVRSAFVRAAIADGAPGGLWDELVRRFDRAAERHRDVVIALAVRAADFSLPSLFASRATRGCSSEERARIEAAWERPR